eukprot:9105139-Karenia_brevis.AAC.1
MLSDILQAIVPIGLEIHSGKTKVLHNEYASHAQHQALNVDGCSFEVLPPGKGTSYLGRLLSFTDFHDLELDNRLQLAWKKFFSLKKELCNKDFYIGSRLRLFQATVAATALYSAGTWTLNADRETKL